MLFRRCYACVSTRGFNYGLDHMTLIPLVDCLNHSHYADSNYCFVNKGLHVDPLEEQSYFSTEKYLNDVSLIYQTGSQDDKEALDSDLIKGFQVTAEYE